MPSKPRARLTFANVISLIALFVALGGSSYAAIKVTGKNVKDSSLTGKDLKNSSVTGADVRNGSLLGADFKAGQLPAGPQGPRGDAGQKGDIGATGAAGPTGPPLFVDALQGGDFTPTPPNAAGCTAAAEWRECAKVTVNVPAGKTYSLAIDSDGSYFAFNKTTNVRVCTSVRSSTDVFETTAAVKPASCTNQPTGILLTNDLESVGTNGVREVSGGASGTSYVVSTAVRPEAALDFYNGYRYEVVHTLVTVSQKP